MKRVLLTICCVCVSFLCGCGSSKEFYGKYVSMSGNINAAYSKDYVMMDCCKEWNDIVLFANLIPNAAYVEAFEYYLYDENENSIQNDKPLTITIHPSEHFNDVAYSDMHVYFLNDYTPIEITFTNEGYSFETDKTGIILLVKTNTNGMPVYIRNDECFGQCKTCSSY